jgi:hypothetical protein
MEKPWRPAPRRNLRDKIWDLFDAATGFVASALEYSATFGAGYRRARFGHLGDLLYITGLVDTDSVRDVHFNINFWTDEEVMAWKNAFISSCNATLIAGGMSEPRARCQRTKAISNFRHAWPPGVSAS